MDKLKRILIVKAYLRFFDDVFVEREAQINRLDHKFDTERKCKQINAIKENFL